MLSDSIIEIDVMSRIPASTAIGIHWTKLPKKRTTNKTVMQFTSPPNGVRAPALTLTTVAIVEPATGKPPKEAEAMFPNPWPNNSLVLLC